MVRVGVCSAHLDGFWAQISLNRGPFFGRFFLRVGYPEIGRN